MPIQVAEKPRRRIRVVAELIVDDDVWTERQEKGVSDMYLVGEVKKTIRIEGDGLFEDVEVQQVELVAGGAA